MRLQLMQLVMTADASCSTCSRITSTSAGSAKGHLSGAETREASSRCMAATRCSIDPEQSKDAECAGTEA